jgi:NAD-dependent deacetylase
VHRFYNKRRADLDDVVPNATHEAIARLSASPNYDVRLITQNVDDLHERAGSWELLHMHGELRKARCVSCSSVTDHFEDLGVANRCSMCGGFMRPHIVWFGEVPFGIDLIGSALKDADIFVAIGTSGKVEPAASLVLEARRQGAHTISINREIVRNDDLFDESILGVATQAVPRFVDDLLAQ